MSELASGEHSCACSLGFELNIRRDGEKTCGRKNCGVIPEIEFAEMEFIPYKEDAPPEPDPEPPGHRDFRGQDEVHLQDGVLH